MEKQNRHIKKILKILNTFSDDQQEIFIWHIVFKDKAPKIAEDLKYDEDYVRSQLKLMKRALRWTWRTKWYAATHELFAKKLVVKTKPHLIFEKIEEQLTYDEQHMLGESLLFHPQPELSPAQKRIRKLRRLRRYVARYSKVAMFTLLFMILCTGTAFAMIHLGLIPNDKSVHVYTNSSEGKPLEAIEQLYLPEYLPAGYELLTQNGVPYETNIIKTIYVFNENEIFLEQNISQTVINLDNENLVSTHINIKNNQGIYQVKNDFKMLVWAEKEYFYSISCNSPDIDKNELKKIAESLKESSYEKD